MLSVNYRAAACSFSQLSDRLVTKNGVYMMGLAAAAALLYTRGDILTLVVMYSINVFITFSLTELGMARHWIKDRDKEPTWKSQLAIHGTGLQANTETSLLKYVAWAQAHGFRADYRMALGTEAVATVEAICLDVAKEFPRAILFTGRLIFKEEKWYHRLLHNETPHAIQRRLQFEGIQAMVLPIRVLE